MQTRTHDEAASPWQILIAGKLYAPEEIAGPVAVVIEGQKIRDIWRDTGAAAAGPRFAVRWPGSTVEVIDLASYRLAPGYIDLHIHGLYGHDVAKGRPEDVVSMARRLPQTGVTAFFPTIATLEQARTAQLVQRVAEVARKQRHPSAAEIMGLRLEGPFINRAKKGAQYEPGIRRPDPLEMEKLAEAGLNRIRIVDFAPEQDESGRFLATLVRLGIIASIGHSAASYDEAIRAIDEGARHSTHLYNAMSALEHRSPGVAAAVLTDVRVTAELIADGIHIHPAMLKLAVEARGPSAIALVTDAVAPAGLPEGDYDFLGRTVTVREGAVRLENGSLAGSTLTLERAVRNMVNLVGLSWSDAIRMATSTPARISGIDDRKGCIAPGADADLVALDHDGFVRSTWTRGFLTFQNTPAGYKVVEIQQR